MDAYKRVPVVNLPPVSFIDGPSKHGRTRNIQEGCDPDISVAVVTVVVVPVWESLSEIGINARIAVIRLECYF